jgi:hypothetical protein
VVARRPSSCMVVWVRSLVDEAGGGDAVVLGPGGQAPAGVPARDQLHVHGVAPVACDVPVWCQWVGVSGWVSVTARQIVVSRLVGC